MTPRVKKHLTNLIRWGVAILGIAWVFNHLNLRDSVWVLGPKNLPMAVALSTRHNETSDTYSILDANGTEQIISSRNTVLRPDRDRVTLNDGHSARVRAIHAEPLNEPNRVTEVLIEDPSSGLGTWIPLTDIQGGYRQDVFYPRIERGLIRMVQEADLRYLLLAIAIFPITFIITAFRWYELLKALDISIGLRRAFVINMVGAFYNTFMPGSTGGDVLRAYYAAKHTEHRTRAVMSVIVDRAIGLLALIILGGTMAALQYQIPECRKVARGAAIACAMTVAGLAVYYVPLLRRIFLVDFIVKKLPMQRRVQHAVETMDIYGRRPGLALAALVASFPVHATVVVSAAFSGKAFGLPIAWGYYWVVVPVIVLAGSIPISPQGAGVMEFFAVKLTQTRGVTVGQAVALTMSVRLVQILWNLTGGIFVMRGGFHAPTEKEQHELEDDAPLDEATHP